MLNMKKGLALVLAAATAFTFAPVSTLGLQSVVEAHADDTKSTATAAGTISEGTSDNPVTIDLTSLLTNGHYYLLTVDDKLSVTGDTYPVYKTSEVTEWTSINGTANCYFNASEGTSFGITNKDNKAHKYALIDMGEGVSFVPANSTQVVRPIDRLITDEAFKNSDDEYKSARGVSSEGINKANSATTGTIAVEAAKSGVTVTSQDKATQAEINEAITDKAEEINDYIADQINQIETNDDGTAKDSDKQTQLDTLKKQQTQVTDIVEKAQSDYAKTAAVEKPTDTFGGVTTNLLLTDDTSYSLVNSDATFTPNGSKTSYTADQLKWYLTKVPSTDPKNIRFTESAGAITESGTGKLDIKVSNAKTFESEMKDAYIIGVYPAGADTTVIYESKVTVKAEDSGVVTRHYDAKTISATQEQVNGSKSDTGKELSNSFLDDVRLIGTNNKFLDGLNSTIVTGTDFSTPVTGRNFTINVKDNANKDENGFKTSTIYINTGKPISKDGVYYETLYVPYKDTAEDRTFIAEISVKVSVNAGPTVEVKDGDFTYSLDSADDPNRDSKVIDLDLTANKTFDIAAHSYPSVDNTTYEYKVNTQNVTVDAKGVATAAKIGTATVTITPSANGVKGKAVYLFFRVNQNSHDSINVTGKDGDKATVLTTREFNANASKLKDEKGLAAAQVGYVQIEVTGDEASDVKENLTVKGAGRLSFSLANDTDSDKASVDAKTGTVTVKHKYLNDNFKTYHAPVVIPVKVVSTETNTSALTTGYFYTVVDYADASISGLEDTYTVGTSITTPDVAAYLNLGNEANDGMRTPTQYGTVHISANGSFDFDILGKGDDLDTANLYETDDKTAFDNVNDGQSIRRGLVAGKTEHVLVTVADKDHKVGETYRVVTIKSVAGQTNYVSKIENADTGKTVYQQGAGVNTGASITINKPTVVKVTVAYAPSATLNVTSDPAFTLGNGSNGFNYNTENEFVAATENPKTYEVTLIPSAEGTNIVRLSPTQGRLSETDYSLVGREEFSLAVKYSTADSKTPAQVKGVKIGNKKGAKVVVKFTKDTTDKNIKYYVQKKIGNKTSGKSVGSNRTILSVAKGKTVKVRVKAYYYDANGTKHVGKYSKWVTKKTDKK